MGALHLLKRGNLRLAFRSVPVACVYSLPREVCWGKGALYVVPQLGWTVLRLLVMIIVQPPAQWS